ncbi:SLC41 divalent cation transporter [Trypanosoma melophagium]|uniref:SLC41 divalent cation transporter n=1 Tax=Trypanosoma melophagium TaxID=715481 RepID=UPI00351A35BA|nr:SLC41 divalent cation transporter [Trypanosoma melophagium]
MYTPWNSTLISGSQESGSYLKNDVNRFIPRRDRNTTFDSENENDMVDALISTGASSNSSGVFGNNSSNSTIASLRFARILLNASVFTIARKRFVLLAVLLAMQSGSQLVLQQYEELIKKHVVIVLFMSMVVGAGGNAGNQAAVSVITALLASRDGRNNIRTLEGDVEAVRGRFSRQKEHSNRLLTTTTATTTTTTNNNNNNNNNNTIIPVVSTAGKLVWRRLISYTVRFIRLPRVLLGRRWRRFCGEVGYPVGVALTTVLRFELLVGLCCGVIIMSIGALRVGFFVWWDEEDHIHNRPASGVGGGGTSTLLTEWGSNAGIIVGISLSLFMIVFLSVLIGATLPYILLYFGANVEHAAPIVQVLMDLLGTWICCITCNAFLPSILGSNETAGLNG